jgi:branched-chain amino acid transport system substrate-binding protein
MNTWLRSAAALVVFSLVVCGYATSGANPPKSSHLGTPITIGGMDSLSNPEYSAPETRSGIDAAIADINSHGGIDHRPLRLDFCDTDFNANLELSCTERLIGSQVAALVAPSILADPSGREYSLAASAKMPIIGSQGLLPAELQCKVVFPLSSGIPGWFYGVVAALVNKGDKRISVITDPGPSSQFAANLTDAAIRLAGLTPVQTITADVASDPTLSSAVARAVQGANGIAIVSGPDIVPRIVADIRETSFAGGISSTSALFPSQILQSLGSAANGILLDSQTALPTDTNNSGVVRFLADMKRYEPGARIDSQSITAWTATMLFAAVTRRTHATTSATVLHAFNTLNTAVDLGTIAPYKVVGQKSPLPKLYPRIFNSTIAVGTIRDGKVVTNGAGFSDPFTTLSGLAHS